MTDNEALRSYLDSLPYKEHCNTVKRIQSATGVARCIVSNWKNSAQRIPPMAKLAIETIADKRIFDPYEKPAIEITLKA